MKKLLIPFLWIVFPFYSFVLVATRKNVVGNWKLVSASSTVGGVKTNCDMQGFFPVYSFLDNGDYKETVDGKPYQVGSWKFVVPDSILVYAAKTVPDMRGILCDHTEPIISLNDSIMVLGEYMCSEVEMEDVVFKRVAVVDYK
ncbi:MAG: hypothetical protein HY064_13545 [Bacteroidetes bacterium]|nr:hypothetical protein [Bacteroidota bacterium]